MPRQFEVGRLIADFQGLGRVRYGRSSYCDSHGFPPDVQLYPESRTQVRGSKRQAGWFSTRPMTADRLIQGMAEGGDFRIVAAQTTGTVESARSLLDLAPV